MDVDAAEEGVLYLPNGRRVKTNPPTLPWAWDEGVDYIPKSEPKLFKNLKVAVIDSMVPKQETAAELREENRRLRFRLSLQESMEKGSVRFSHEQARAARDMAALWPRISLEYTFDRTVNVDLVNMMSDAVRRFAAAPVDSEKGMAEVVLSMMEMERELADA